MSCHSSNKCKMQDAVIFEAGCKDTRLHFVSTGPQCQPHVGAGLFLCQQFFLCIDAL